MFVIVALSRHIGVISFDAPFLSCENTVMYFDELFNELIRVKVKNTAPRKYNRCTLNPPTK